MGRAMRRLARLVTRKWPDPIYELRRELGLPRGRQSALRCQALAVPGAGAVFAACWEWSRKIGRANTLITGFCYYDADGGNAGLPRAPREISERGAAAGGVYAGIGRGAGGGKVLRVLGARGDQAGRARGAADRRSDDRATGRSHALPESICVAEYAPYPALFGRAAMVVHQGGVGTTAQCLRAGKPMLIMPYSHDQPDNARRMRRLKVARVIRRGDYTPMRVARKVRAMLEEPKFARRAESVARDWSARMVCGRLAKRWKSCGRGREMKLPASSS